MHSQVILLNTPVAHEQAGLHRVSCEIQVPESESATIFYESPEEISPRPHDLGNAFLLGTLFVAMNLGRPIHYCGSASASLLANLEEYQAAFSAWYPDRYRAVEISVEQVIEENERSGEDGLFAFSGGLDSSFSMFRHVHRLAGRRSVRPGAALMVQGLDIGLDNAPDFASAAAKAAATVDSVGVPLITMRTNLRDIVGRYYRDYHAAGLVSCMHLLGHRFRHAVIPGTYQYSRLELMKHGSNPLTDRLLSSAGLEVVHDGAEFFRAEKAVSVAAWPEAMRNLRVCWEGAAQDRNCGVCSKCIRMITIFWALGIDDLPAFDRQPTSANIRALELADQSYLDPVREILDLAGQRGRSDAWWAIDLDQCLSNNIERLASG